MCPERLAGTGSAERRGREGSVSDARAGEEALCWEGGQEVQGS